MLVEKAVKQISDKTGVDANEITSVIEDWATPLMQNGIIVKIGMKHWRATQSIDKDDMGFEEATPEWDRFSSEYMRFGVKYLLPREVLTQIGQVENNARKNLKDYSLNTVWGKFVPYTSYMDWKTRNETIEEEYYALSKNLYDNYEQIVESVLEQYKSHAKTLWESKQKTEDETYEDFEKQITDDIRNHIISAEEFLESFKYETLFFFIPIPTDINQDLLDAENMENEKEKVSQERIVRAEIMKETARLKSEYIEQFLDNTIGEIRGMILGIVEDVRRSMEVHSDNLLVGKNRNKLIGMIEKVRLLDFYDDKEVKRSLDQLQIDLEKSPADRSEKEVLDTLSGLESAAKSGIQNLLGGRTRFLEV